MVSSNCRGAACCTRTRQERTPIDWFRSPYLKHLWERTGQSSFMADAIDFFLDRQFVQIRMRKAEEQTDAAFE